MNKQFVSYLSKNGIQFHHTLSAYEAGEQPVQRAESHDMCELFLLLNGRVRYSIEGNQYFLSPMDVILISPHELHSIQIDTTQNYERMVLHFSPDILPVFQDFNPMQPFENAKCIDHKISARLIKNSNFYALFQEIKELCPHKTAYTDWKIMGVIHRIIETLDEISNLHITNLRENVNAQSSILTVASLSRRCIDYINTHINEDLGAPAISRHLNVSASYLQHTFKKEIGITLQQYVHTQKMQHAQKLLLDGISPQEVSDILGYSYYATFYKNYVKYFSRKPSKIPFFHQRRVIDDKELDPTPKPPPV